MSKDKNNILGAFNIRKFILVCLKYWYVFVISVLACVSVAGVLAVLRPQSQEVLAQLMIKDDTGGGSSMFMAGQIARSFSIGNMFGSVSSTDNEMIMIKSHTVFLNTVKQLDLNTSCYVKKNFLQWKEEFTTAPLVLKADPNVADTISKFLLFKLDRVDNDKFDIDLVIKRSVIAKATDVTLPFTFDTPYGQFEIDKTEYLDKCSADKFKLTFCSYDGAASAYTHAVSVYVPDRKTDFINISYVTDDPEFGKKLINTIIDYYDDLSNVYRAKRSSQSLKLVDSRLESLQAELLQSEADLEIFKKQNNLTDVQVDAQYLMTKTGALESSLLEAQTNYEVIKLTKEFISNPENNYSLIPDLFVSATTSAGENSASIAKYNEMILERMQLQSSAKGNNSLIKQLDQQIDALRGTIITSINRAYQNSALVLRDLKNENSKNQSRLGELPTIERQYIVLKRDNLLQEQIYLFLLQQREELGMSLNSRTIPAIVIDQPYVLDQLPGLSKKMKLALGFVLGCLFAAVYLFVMKMRKYPMTSLSELKSTAEAPTIQSIAYDKTDNGKFALNDDDVNAEPFRKLRSDVQFALSSCQGKVVVVTSVNDDEGKTFVATNLAASLAMTGANVTLVDTSLRDPKIASNLGINDRQPILSEYVYSDSDNIPVAKIDVDGHYSMEVIASQAVEPNVADLVASNRFSELLSKLRQTNDYVVIDSSRIKDCSDIYYLTELTDITLIVCRGGIITDVDIAMLNGLYDDARLKRMAIVPNAFKA